MENLTRTPYKNLKVYYGIRKIKGIIKKPSICVWFENANNNPEKNLSFINKAMYLCYTRYQTPGEAMDSINSNRMFTCYEIKFLEKPFKGDWYYALEINDLKDQYNVSIKERKSIFKSLENQLKVHYPLNHNRKGQLSLINNLFQ